MGITAARAGSRTLIVSTDPAPSLGDALRQRLGRTPRAVRGVAGLYAVEVDAPAALDAWIGSRRELLEAIALRGSWLDREDVTQLLRLSLPGIDEIAGLLQIADYSASGKYDRIVVDTAPTGHMLRMLSMPTVLGGLAQVFDRMQGKHRIMVEAIRGGWTPDAADILIDSIDEQAQRMDRLLRDSQTSRMAWVTLPEAMAVAETADALRALHTQGVTVDRIIVNRVTAPPPAPCRWCQARRRTEQHTIATLGAGPAGQAGPVLVPAIEREPRGTSALARIGRIIERPSPRRTAKSTATVKTRVTATLRGRQDFEALDPGALFPSTIRLLMFGGKGGVGKTTCAAALAVHAASGKPKRRVLLLSADPAHSLGDVFGASLSDEERALRGGPRNLTVRELDARRGFEQLRERFAGAIEELFARLAGGGGMPAQASGHDRQVLNDLFELAPPGVDELVAIIEVTDALLSSDGDRRFDLVIIDTAPTGHALRLLEMPALVHQWVKAVMAILLKYQSVMGVGELGAVLLRLSQGLNRLRDLLADHARTAFVVVTRPAQLPRAETVRLAGRLRAASIHVPVVIVNAFGAGSCSRCDRERQAQTRELTALRRDLGSNRGALSSLAVTPGWIPPPRGFRDLLAFAAEWRRAPHSRR
jgi:arsenite/tail-anchored protein-transporting ATPase